MKRLIFPIIIIFFENDNFRSSDVALMGFINDRVIRSYSFDRLRLKMEDYLSVSRALVLANDADISDHRMLITAVDGEEDLVGADIFFLLEANTHLRNTAQSRMNHYLARANRMQNEMSSNVQ